MRTHVTYCPSLKRVAVPWACHPVGLISGMQRQVPIFGARPARNLCWAVDNCARQNRIGNHSFWSFGSVQGLFTSTAGIVSVVELPLLSPERQHHASCFLHEHEGRRGEDYACRKCSLLLGLHPQEKSARGGWRSAV